MDIGNAIHGVKHRMITVQNNIKKLGCPVYNTVDLTVLGWLKGHPWVASSDPLQDGEVQSLIKTWWPGT